MFPDKYSSSNREAASCSSSGSGQAKALDTDIVFCLLIIITDQKWVGTDG